MRRRSSNIRSASIRRFDLYLQVLQERVAFDDKILLPLAEHLFVVARDGQRVVKCDCGYVFGPVDRNWKRETRILVRDSEELLEEIYDPYHRCDPEWMELWEYFCPGCWSLLEVEVVPPGYPCCSTSSRTSTRSTRASSDALRRTARPDRPPMHACPARGRGRAPGTGALERKPLAMGRWLKSDQPDTTRPASQPAAQPGTSQGATDHYCPARSSAYPADSPNVVIAHQPMMNDCLHAGAPQHSRIMTLSARPHLHPRGCVWIHRTVSICAAVWVCPRTRRRAHSGRSDLAPAHLAWPSPSRCVRRAGAVTRFRVTALGLVAPGASGGPLRLGVAGSLACPGVPGSWSAT